MNKTAAAFACLALGAGLWFHFSDSGDSEITDGSSVTWKNRVWIDKIPSSNSDKIDVLVAIDDPMMGVFQRTSAYEGDFSVFAWEGKGKAVKIRMLQTDKTSQVKFAPSKDGCGHFDYCMKVRGAPRGGKQYFSMEDWVIEGTDSVASISADTSRAVLAKVFASQKP